MKTISIELTEEEAKTVEVSTQAHSIKLDETIRECTDVPGTIKEIMINQKASADSAAEKIKKAIYRS